MQHWLTLPVQTIDQQAIGQARAHQAMLTKPRGSLGRLEKLAEQFAGWQGQPQPVINKISVAVFAGDHGVCEQAVSAFPQAVTMQMIINFLEGGAAISVLSRALAADFTVINMGIVNPLPDSYGHHPHLVNANIAAGTADFSVRAAMTESQLDQALQQGQKIVEKCIGHDVNDSASNRPRQLLTGGEMGIGNTTSASAMYSALLDLPAAEVVGSGSGLDQTGMVRKQRVIERALELHRNVLQDPWQILRCVGGLEIAGLVGFYVAAAQRGVPVLVDGFIATVAALVAVRVNPGVRDWLLFSHCSTEPAHQPALTELQAEPLLDLGLCLGEGSGAAVAVPIIQAALSLHNSMATFGQAGVSQNH